MSKLPGVASPPNPGDLDEDSPTGAELTNSPREFFWDRIVLFLSSAILGLTALDIVTELLRGGSAVVCFPSEDLNLSDAQGLYVNTFCAQSLPATQYFPIFVFVHGALIAVCHHFWKSSHRVQLDYFFALAAELSRLPDEETGDYPAKNYTIIKKLESEFSTYSRKGLMQTYRLKLALQVLVGAASLIATSVVFTEFDVSFYCPSRNVDTDPFWPLKGTTVQCIFSSLRLFYLVHIADILLLVLILLVALCGLAWTFLRQPDELGYGDVARFSLEAGVGPQYFLPKPWIAGIFKDLRTSGIVETIKSRFLSPCMESDLDFLLILLYRSDGGLGHAFREGQVHRELQRLVESDLQLLNLHVRLDGNTSDAAIDETESEGNEQKCLISNAILKWQFSDNVYNSFRTVPVDQCLYIPDTIQGAVLGFGLRAPNNDRAVDVLFGSAGFSSALARGFSETAFIQFDPLYKDTEKPIVSLSFPVNISGYRCQENILSQEAGSLNQFVENTEEIWSYCGQPNHYKTAFMVIGPITRVTQLTTAKLLVEQLKSKFEEKAILLTVRPVRVEGKRTPKQFYRFIPPNELFAPLVHEVEAVSYPLPWPQPFAVYKTAADVISYQIKANSVFKLKCGRTDCEYELKAYQFIASNADHHGINEGTQLENSTEIYPHLQQNDDFFSSPFNGIAMATATGDVSRVQDPQTGKISGRMLV